MVNEGKLVKGSVLPQIVDFSNTQEAHKDIHEVLRKHSPVGVHKVKDIFKFKYPKFFLFIALIFFSYALFTLPSVSSFFYGLGEINYLGDFIAGIFFTFGFTTPLSIGYFIVTNPSNIFLSSIVAALGSVAGNLLIFKTIRFSFIDEFRELEKKKIVKRIKKIIRNNKSVLIRHYLVYIFAGFMLATPLPDELGISMLAGLTSIKPLKLAIISFILHVIPIFLIFYFSV
ncbi:MAG: hypothetical protein NUV46_02925 [Nanoarchaeota archaeon]|nr:hypothetical protein [Nanoarchaeota archaeon]